MFCALLGQDIRLAFTGPLVLWFKFQTFAINIIVYQKYFLVLLCTAFQKCINLNVLSRNAKYHYKYLIK